MPQDRGPGAGAVLHRWEDRLLKDLESLRTKQWVSPLRDGPERAGRKTRERIDLGITPPAGGGFLRKEVIQPHLPIRLPCYDFVPLTGHTFGTSLSCELGQ